MSAKQKDTVDRSVHITATITPSLNDRVEQYRNAHKHEEPMKRSLLVENALEEYLANHK